MKNSFVFVIITALMVISCGCDTAKTSDNSTTLPQADVIFNNPREVTIIDYAGDAMEPSISFDGRLLYYHQKVSGVFRVYVVSRK